MSIPHRGSRAVTVNGVAYRWRIRKSPTYAQGAYGSSMVLAVQRASAEGPHCVLRVNLVVSRPDAWVAPHQTSVKPSMVCEMIARALEGGWRPDRGGPAFELRFPLIRDGA